MSPAHPAGPVARLWHSTCRQGENTTESGALCSGDWPPTFILEPETFDLKFWEWEIPLSSLSMFEFWPCVLTFNYIVLQHLSSSACAMSREHRPMTYQWASVARNALDWMFFGALSHKTATYCMSTFRADWWEPQSHPLPLPVSKSIDGSYARAKGR